MGKRRSHIRGALALATFLSACRARAKFTEFAKDHQDKFKDWHQSAKSTGDLERIWKKRFRDEAQRLGKSYKLGEYKNREEVWLEVSLSIDKQVQKRIALLATEVQALKDHNIKTITQNKRLQATMEEDNGHKGEMSSQGTGPSSSQTSKENQSSQSSQELEVDNFLPWKVRSVNLSSKLNAFRNLCRNKLNVSNSSTLSRSEILAIDYVYFFDLDGWEDIRNRLLFLHDDVLSAINEDLDQFEMYEDISDQISDHCLTFAKAMCRRDNESVENLLKKKFDKTDDERLVLQIIENLYRTHNSSGLLAVDEDRFGDVVVKPIFDEIMHGIPYTRRDGQFTRLNSKYKVRADATISVLVNEEDIRTLVVEIKSPTKTNEQDFIKLAIEMKIMLDSMVERYINDPVVYGVLVEGFTLRTFKMDLEYNRIYRFIHMRTCYLPRGKDDMDVLRGAIQTLLQLKRVVKRSLVNVRSPWVKNEQTVGRKKCMRPTILLPTSSSMRVISSHI